MKKSYIQPATITLVLQHNSQIMLELSSNAGLGEGGGGNGTGGSTPRVKEYDVISDVNVWDNEW